MLLNGVKRKLYLDLTLNARCRRTKKPYQLILRQHAKNVQKLSRYDTITCPTNQMEFCICSLTHTKGDFVLFDMIICYVVLSLRLHVVVSHKLLDLNRFCNIPNE